jgi:hypothetical protein
MPSGHFLVWTFQTMSNEQHVGVYEVVYLHVMSPGWQAGN